MSVSTSIAPEIDLFVAPSQLGSPLPTGRWRAMALVNGDGTGGTSIIDITPPSAAVAALYMWSVEDVNFTDSPGPAAGGYGSIEWETGMPVIQAAVTMNFTLRASIYIPPPVVGTLNSGINFPVRKWWRFISRPGAGFNFRLRGSFSNTNAHIYQFAAWGYLWNQEYAKFGPAQRPQD